MGEKNKCLYILLILSCFIFCVIMISNNFVYVQTVGDTVNIAFLRQIVIPKCILGALLGISYAVSRENLKWYNILIAVVVFAVFLIYPNMRIWIDKIMESRVLESVDSLSYGNTMHAVKASTLFIGVVILDTFLFITTENSKNVFCVIKEKMHCLVNDFICIIVLKSFLLFLNRCFRIAYSMTLSSTVEIAVEIGCFFVLFYIINLFGNWVIEICKSIN